MERFMESWEFGAALHDLVIATSRASRPEPFVPELKNHGRRGLPGVILPRARERVPIHDPDSPSRFRFNSDSRKDALHMTTINEITSNPQRRTFLGGAVAALLAPRLSRAAVDED